MLTPTVGRHARWSALLAVCFLVGCQVVTADPLPSTRYDVAPSSLTGRVVAVGIPNPSAISPVGTFLPGGPIRDRPEFAAYTEPGRVLDPERILVASTSNFEAPGAQPDHAPGAILSIDRCGAGPLVVPPDFAVVGDQATTLQGCVQVYTAQGTDFLNSRYNPDAVTAAVPSVGNPLAISLNNAFGRPWFASAPLGPSGAGSVAVTDPDGRPLAGAPSKFAGGVFVGRHTGRAPAVIPGAVTGSVGTALLGKSPDGTGRAVFAVANADGGIVQVHVEKGVDGLAPEGTVAPLRDVLPRKSDPTAALATRAGMVFNWVPDAILYVADPVRNALVALMLTEDNQVFRVDSIRRIVVPELNAPVDLAPALPEAVSLAFSSNTTLAGRSDIYVANRGSGTIVRISQHGDVLAVRAVEVPGEGVLGSGRLNGIAVSRDGQTIWVTVTGEIEGFPGQEGSIVELPAFGGPKL